MKLVPNWRQCFKFWSVRLGMLGTALTGLLVAFPEAALHAWSLLPGDMKAFIPQQYMPFIGVGVFALSILARLIKQPKLHDGAPNAER